MKIAYDENHVPYFIHAEGSEAQHIAELLAAEADGRLTILPSAAKEGDPEPECFYNSGSGLWCMGHAISDSDDEPTERCKNCWYCENGYAASELKEV